MLLQNPQLAYALLQAQVVMRIVNPDNALRMLHPKAVTAKTLQAPRYINNMLPNKMHTGFCPPYFLAGYLKILYIQGVQ